MTALALICFLFIAAGVNASTMVIGLELGKTTKKDAIEIVKDGKGSVLKEDRSELFDYALVRGYPLQDVGTIETLLIFNTDGVLCGVHRRVLEDSIFTHLLTFGSQFRIISVAENSISAITKDNISWFKSKDIKYSMDLDGQREVLFDMGDAAALVATAPGGFGSIEITLKEELRKFSEMEPGRQP